ncbi:MAG: hypothetical protein ABH822_01570 [Patescibacteria group bacterium]
MRENGKMKLWIRRGQWCKIREFRLHVITGFESKPSKAGGWVRADFPANQFHETRRTVDGCITLVRRRR